jgi:ribosome biogenesis GTPase A
MNRLLGRHRRRAKTANTPGVTKSLQWMIIVKDSSRQKEFELLD